MECPDAAAMFEYRLALGLLQYDVGDGNMLAGGPERTRERLVEVDFQRYLVKT